jgi:hypothetical protein
MARKSKCTCNLHNDYKGCCEDVFNALNDCKFGLIYNKEYRSHAWLSPQGTGMYHVIDYCPWCGTKFPSSLYDEWDDVVEKEYHMDRAKILVKDAPAEMQTDEWWKKRGL